MRTLIHTLATVPLLCLTALASSAFGNTITVANTNDSGAGSLRAAIESAGSGDVIVFSLTYPAVIRLTSGSLTIDTNLTITGPGASNVTIDAIDNVFMERAFTVGSGVTVSISGVTITGGGGGGTSLGSSANSGGGIFNAGTLILSDAVITNNSTRSQGIGGGGIFNAGGATLTLTNCIVSGNTAGGGTIQQSGPITGGGIRNASSALLTLTNTTVSNNVAQVGGGIWNSGTLTVTGSTFSENSAGVGISTTIVLEGGAIYASSGQSTGSITNSTFFNNSAKNDGAAIASVGTLGVTHSTFVDNWTQAGTGGAVSTLGNVVTLKGTILANATANCSVSGGNFVSGGYNHSTDASCSLAGTGDVSSAPAGLDPAGLQDYGGPTRTIGLLPTSAAVDRIPTPCTDIDGNPLTTDQRGVTRPQGNQCDVGAFELISIEPTITSFTPMSGPVGASVTITGTGLTGATAVVFNGTNAVSFTVNSDNQITAVVPGGASSGSIAVTTPDGTAVSAENYTVLVSPAPTITSFSPVSGGFGASVTISGQNLSGATSVTFGGASAQFTVSNSGKRITAVVPAEATSGSIVVTTQGGTATSAGSFTVIPPPTITGFSPPSGPGGTSVTINGTNFTGATAVMFDGRTASFAVNAAGTQVTATVPSKGLKPGSVAISVTTPGGMATSGTPFTVTK
jgi:hypothetical protein